MKRANRRHKGISGIELLEEALHLLRTKASLLAPYYIGSLPFILGLLFFWTDMSTGSTAWRHLPEAAWGLTILFIWMKTWQSVFSARFLEHVQGETPRPWGLRRALSAAVFQTVIQPWGMIVLPISFFLMLPFPKTLAFFQNFSALGGGQERDLKSVIRQAWEQAGLWPLQNMLVIWLASPFLLITIALMLFVILPVLSLFNPGTSTFFLLFLFMLVMIPLSPLGVITALNIGLAVLLIPNMAKSLFGVETIFTISGSHAINDTLFAVVVSLSYLCLDPLMKAAYSLRCFYGQSLSSGEDLKVELRAVARSKARAGAPSIVAGILAIAVVCSGSLPGDLFAGDIRQKAQDTGESKSETPSPKSLSRQGRGDVDCSLLLIATKWETRTGYENVINYHEVSPKSPLSPPGERDRVRGAAASSYRSSFSFTEYLAPRSFHSASLAGGTPVLQIAEPSSPAARQLDQAIQSVISHPEYTWRMPREKPPADSENNGMLHKFVKSISEALKDGWKYIAKGVGTVMKFISRLIRGLNPQMPEMGRMGQGWSTWSEVLIYIPLALIVAIVAFLAWRVWKERTPVSRITPAPAPSVVDITREDVDAALLPEDGWLNLARELMQKGELRLALRAFYLASLAHLAAKDLITIATYKTEREYEQELKRRALTQPDLIGVFAENRTLFERAWYGLYEVTPAIMEQFSQNQERIRTYAQG